MKNLISIIGGIIFSFGLAVSGMINPTKVIGFLDLWGDWDYSLAFVMGGALGVNFVLFPFIFKRSPIYSKTFQISLKKDLDLKLIIGSIFFGVGWGMAGICPGPGIVNLSRLDLESVAFVIATLIGMFVHNLYKKSKVK